MKKIIFATLIVVLSLSGIAQSSYLYTSTSYGTSALSAFSTTNSITGLSTYYSNVNSLGTWQAAAYSVPNTYGQYGGSSLYSYNSYGSLDLRSFSTYNTGGIATIYTQNSFGNFSPSTYISPNYGGTYSVYTRDQYGNFNQTGYYNPAIGQGYLSTGSTVYNIYR